MADLGMGAICGPFQFLFWLVSTFVIRILEVIGAPIFIQPKMLWMVVPIATATVLITLYMAFYKEEELSWTTIYSNTLVLVFVSLDSLRNIYTSAGDNVSGYILEPHKTFIAFGLLIFGIILFIIHFFRILPKKISTRISAHLPMNLLAYFTMVMVYTKIPPDLFTLAAFTVIFVALNYVFSFIRAETEKRYESLKKEKEREAEEERLIKKVKELHKQQSKPKEEAHESEHKRAISE